KNLVGATAAHAKEALTVRVVLVTADGLELTVFHFDQHSAERWMAIHGTHGPDDFCFAASHGHLRLTSLELLVALPTEQLSRAPTAVVALGQPSYKSRTASCQ